MNQPNTMSDATLDELPKQYDPQAAQQRWYRFWEESGYFHCEPDPTRESYTICIPPPNVTGALHLGHALNNTLQDILIRQKRMQGFDVLWMPGTDHAGIATQAVVERRLLEEEGKTRHDLGREQLVERIWAWKDQYETRILEQLKQMGCSCDWQRLRFTLDPVCARAVRETFFRLFRDQKIYRGKRLVNWDTFLQTAVSDDEVFHETVEGYFWHFKYPVIDPKPGEPTHVSIATTRPETMLGDTAVAVHPDPAQALDQAEAELVVKRAAAAEKDQDDLDVQIKNLQRRRTDLLPQLVQLRDMARDGRCVLLPLVDRAIPLVTDAWAKPELGSGCVKITPAHDPNDYEVGIRQDLPRVNILNRDGTLNANAGDYQGETTASARKRVVADLEALELMEQIEDRVIDLAHSDRSNTPIEPYLADQWFVAMDMLAQTAMDAVTEQQVKIIPSRYAKGYLDWLSEKRDWPVSRQLWWGHRIPIWSCRVEDQKTLDALQSQLQSDPAAIQDPATGEAHLAFQVSVDDDAEEGATVPATVQVCLRDEDKETQQRVEAMGLVQDADVLDTWFSSALWPHSTLGWPDKTPELDHFYPTSTVITSRDIITLWVARMVLAGLYNVGQVPFREVYIHPKILDGFGEGMSKSKGNGVDPLDVIDKFGTDALRFGLTFITTETQDVRMPVEFECPHCHGLVDQTKKNRVLPVVPCTKCGELFATQWASTEEHKALPRGAVVSERFELGRNFCNKLWNASRFAMMNLDGYTPAAVADEDLKIEDRWILSRLATLAEGVTEALSDYRYAEAARMLYDFAWDEFCSFYIEMTKARFSDPAQAPVAQRVLAHTLDTLLRLLHPIIPFLTEEVWQLLATYAPQRGIDAPSEAAESVMIAPWPEADAARQDPVIEQRFASFQTALGALREIRSRQNIAPKQEIEFSVRCDAAAVELLQPMEPYFASMAHAKATGWGPDIVAPALSSQSSSGGIELFVDLADLIDVDAEIARNEAEITRIERVITGKQKKLANANFVDRAPADVVQRERDALVTLDQQLTSIRKALENLRAR